MRSLPTQSRGNFEVAATLKKHWAAAEGWVAVVPQESGAIL